MDCRLEYVLLYVYNGRADPSPVDIRLSAHLVSQSIHIRPLASHASQFHIRTTLLGSDCPARGPNSATLHNLTPPHGDLKPDGRLYCSSV